ncbi:exopolysaccharide biosynthesis polyprenyl glycosylphosphotransferase [Marinospirillum sp.]|uniref:exopolysaccharide biosynthesis polyprenyl glycosylphosphotransferase n=1 Tax=Marinospirillum sp. TaxID=2183934 RepID=UPI00384EBC07
MKHQFERRHSRWYERLLFSVVFQFLIGGLLVVLFPGWLRWEEIVTLQPFEVVQRNTLLANLGAFVIIFIALRRLQRFPGAQTLAYILPTITLAYLIAVAFLFFLREEYARQVLFHSFVVANFWAFLGYYLGRKYRVPKLALVPFGRALELVDRNNAMIFLLESPDLVGRRYDAVVADLHSKDLPPEWERFLASCTLAHVPVWHFKQVGESLSGRVRIEHLSENDFGSLLPPLFYLGFKRLIDTLVALLLFPVLSPIMLLTAFLIKLDSCGPVFFIQERMGYRGVPFKVYKFRSMCNKTRGKGFTEGENDPRITRVGRVIRKYRIDELPQIFNVIKGEMSFIGPRPESLELSDWYEKDVPFFSYRHVVRPGISGWAQVMQGYAAEVDGMTEKLQYDFYYIKHFSLWLDVLIVFKTIRTILTGFGAR